MALVFTGCVVPVEQAAEGTAVKWRRVAGSRCEGVDIVFFPGGPPGGAFAARVQRCDQAEADLGCKVEYVWSDWDPEKMVRQFREAAATRPDGIAVMGHPGDDAFDPLIDDARGKGIIVTSQNTTLHRGSQVLRRGFRLRGGELYAGHELGAEAFKRPACGGDRAMVWGLLPSRPGGLRTQGAIDALEEPAWWSTISRSTPPPMPTPLPAPRPSPPTSLQSDVKLVVTDHGGLTATFETYLKAAGRPRRHLCRRLRPLRGDDGGDPRRLDRPGDRPAALAAGLPAHPADLPDQSSTASPACTSTPAPALPTRTT